MNITIKILFLFFIFQTTLQSQISTSNNGSTNCLYTFSDNSQVDLSPLRKEKDFTFPVGRYIYKGNFCGSQIDKCSGLNLPASIYIRRN